MTHAYAENQLVSQSASDLFAPRDECCGTSGGTAIATLDRETKGVLMLVGRLRAALSDIFAEPELSFRLHKCTSGVSRLRKLTAPTNGFKWAGRMLPCHLSGQIDVEAIDHA